MSSAVSSAVSSAASSAASSAVSSVRLGAKSLGLKVLESVLTAALVFGDWSLVFLGFFWS